MTCNTRSQQMMHVFSHTLTFELHVVHDTQANAFTQLRDHAVVTKSFDELGQVGLGMCFEVLFAYLYLCEESGKSGNLFIARQCGNQHEIEFD